MSGAALYGKKLPCLVRSGSVQLFLQSPERIMILQGTLVNIAAIAAGCLVGRWAGQFLSDRVRNTMMAGLGLAVLLIGLQLALPSQQPMIVIGSIILGGRLGELLN